MIFKKLIFLIFISNLLYAQGKYDATLLIPYNLESKWGFCDTLGNIKIIPIYDSVSFFEINKFNNFSFLYARVFLNKKESIINEKGKLHFPFFDKVQSYNNNVFIVNQANKIGVYYNGILTIPIIYDSIIDISNLLFRTTNTKIILKVNENFFTVDYVTGVKCKVAYLTNSVNISKTTGAIRFNGSSNNGLFVDDVLNDASTEESIKAYNNKIFSELKVKYKLDSVAILYNNSYSNQSGKMETYYKIYKNKLVGLWNRNFLVEPNFSEVDIVYKNKNIQIVVYKKNKRGIINEKSEVILPIEYDYFGKVNDSLFITYKNGMAGASFLYSNISSIVNKYSKLDFFTCIKVSATQCFTVFKTESKNKTVYIGQNGIEYFKK